jgi:glycosyltransferase involved in cell wall biosynthesis
VLPTAEALIEALTRYLANPRKYASMGTRGRAFVEEHYAWERVWQEYEDVLGLK